VFIIRSQNQEDLKSRTTLHLVGLSLLASLFSVANKYIWVDEECAVEHAEHAQWSSKTPYVNKWYLLRVLWRFANVTVRIAIFSMLWSVIGGAFLGIFIPLSRLYWFIIMMIAFEM